MSAQDIGLSVYKTTRNHQAMFQIWVCFITLRTCCNVKMDSFCLELRYIERKKQNGVELELD